MHTNTTAEGASLIANQDEFIDLVCSDKDWVRAEFDAIVADWASPPPAEAGRTVPTPGLHPAQLPPHADPVLRPRRPQRPGTDGWVRQRSPPQQHAEPTSGNASQHDTEKAGGRQ